MRGLRAVRLLGSVALLSAVCGHGVIEAAPVDLTARGSGRIVVFGKGVDVRVTDPLGRFTWWNGDTIANGIPGCEAIGEEPLAEEGSKGDENPKTEFQLNPLVPGEYEIRIRGREDVDVYLGVYRYSEKGARAFADGSATLRRGRSAVWEVAWGCKAESDTCWVTVTQVRGPRTKQLVR